MRSHSITKSIVSYFVRALGIFLVVFTSMAAILGFSTAIKVNNEGSTGIRYSNPDETDHVCIIQVDKNMPAYEAGIRVGDTLIKINGQPVNNAETIRRERETRVIGAKVVYTLRENNIEKDITVTLVSLAPQEKILSVLFRIFPVITLFAYVAVGLWGIFKNPYANETIVIAMFCFCFGSFMYATIDAGYDPSSFVRKYLYFDRLREFIAYIMWFGASFWLYLFATFPKKSRFVERHKVTSLIFIFLIPIVATLTDFFDVQSTLLGYLLISLIFLNMAIGVVLLNKNARESVNALEKRQIRLMLFGIKYGAISIGIGWIIIISSNFVMGKQVGYTILFISYIIFLLGEIGGLIIPFTFLNSFSQNRLLETEGALKRRVRYIGVTIGLLAVYMLFIFIIGRLSVNIFELRDPTIIIVIVLLLSLTFTPINKRLLQWIDEQFYPERTKYAESLKHYIHRLSGKIDSIELMDELKNWVQTTIGINPVIPFAISMSTPSGSYPVHRIPFRMHEKESVVHRIRNGNKFFWDEISERSRIVVDETEIDWVRENDISVTIPMISQGELIGVLNLGKKAGDNDFSAEDMDILTQASNQTALALQNLNLQSEHIEKKRMDKELEMARSIQRRLMPQDLPHVKGLDIAGVSTPCFEVAGDYFDIINMEDGKTALVVADVSGKGAGAAMIMANLQASVRVGIEISEDFGKFIERINNHIFKNTAPTEFITFFMGVWVPEEKTIYYVNAGHNPPLVIDINNNVKTLNATGLILGVLQNEKYEVNTVKIDNGSLLVIYSDGLEEAMNPRNEMFGLDKIISSIKESKEQNPGEIIKHVQSRAIEFCEGKPLHDDLTMIVAKGNNIDHI